MIFVFFMAAIIINSKIAESAIFGLSCVFFGLFVWLCVSIGRPLRQYSWLISIYVIYSISKSINHDSIFTVNIAQPLILFFVLSCRFPVEWDVSGLSTAVTPILGLIMVFSFLTSLVGDSLFINPNTAGAIAALVIIEVLSSPVQKQSILVRAFTIFAACMVLFQSESRGALLLVISYVGIAYFRSLHRLSENRLAFSVLLLFVSSSPFFYELYNSYFDPTASITILGKPLESGRQVIWQLMLEQFWVYPIFGHGRIDPGYFLEQHYFGLSAHNLYLQTAFQFGAVGLVLLVLIFIVQHARLQGPLPPAFQGRALLCAVLVHEMFEVSLTQNNFAFGILVWALLARFEALNEAIPNSRVTNDHSRLGKDRDAAVHVEFEAGSRFPDQRRDDVPIVSHTGERLM